MILDFSFLQPPAYKYILKCLVYPGVEVSKREVLEM